MIFRETSIRGAYLVEPESHHDERGSFARTWCRREFARNGLRVEFVQDSLSFNGRAATLRGLHYQSKPHSEIKLVRCIKGVVHDVIVDLRPDSQTYLEHFACELSEENALALYVPHGMAHGFLTLVDDSVVAYKISEYYVSEHACGVRHDDPRLGIVWPLSPRLISSKDRNWPSIDLLTVRDRVT